MPFPEFRPWGKTPRLFKGVVITEKIDGTNGCIVVLEDGAGVFAQSRGGFITPSQDNHGFAAWVYAHDSTLEDTLGPGYHYGEWWGSGIQRGYGLAKGDKRFSLFNTARWSHDPDSYFSLDQVPGLGVVPILHEGLFSELDIEASLVYLHDFGSLAAPGYMNPEGVCIFHSASRQIYKVTLENDSEAKSAVLSMPLVDAVAA